MTAAASSILRSSIRPCKNSHNCMLENSFFTLIRLTKTTITYQTILKADNNKQLDDIQSITLAHENPLTRVCCWVDSDLNSSICHSDSVSPIKKN